MACRTVVIGAGISGLAAAFRLHEAEESFVVLESEPEPGGKVATHEFQGHRLEHGPNSFLNSYRPLMELIDRLGLHGEVLDASEKATKRFIVHRKKLHPLPTGPGSLLTSGLLSPYAKARILLEPILARRGTDPDESFDSFVRRHFGSEVAQTIAAPFVSGIFAGDPKTLSPAAAFPRVVALEQQHRSLLKAAASSGVRPGLCSVQGGLGRIPSVLVARLGDAVKRQAYVQSIAQRHDHYVVSTTEASYDCEQVIVATPAGNAGQIVSEINGVVGEILQSIQTVPMKVVHTIVDRKAIRHPLDGFGYLVPRGEKIRHLGTIFNSSCFPDHSPKEEVLFTSFLGGAFDLEVTEKEESHLLRELHNEHIALGIYDGEPLAQSIVTWPRAIPQYQIGHLHAVARLADALKMTPGIHLCGNYLRGISLGECVASGNEAADRVLTSNPL